MELLILAHHVVELFLEQVVNNALIRLVFRAKLAPQPVSVPLRDLLQCGNGAG